MTCLSTVKGKIQPWLTRRLAFLRLWGALRWRPSGRGTLRIACKPGSTIAMTPGCSFQDSRNWEKPDLSLLSLFNVRSKILDPMEKEEGLRERANSRILEFWNPGISLQESRSIRPAPDERIRLLNHDFGSSFNRKDAKGAKV